MRKKFVVISIITAGAIGAFANDSLIKQALDAGLKPIPESKSKLYKIIDNPKNPITEAKVRLGKKLYFDPRLSKSGLISCNTCHNLATGGVDGVDVSTGHKMERFGI